MTLSGGARPPFLACDAPRGCATLWERRDGPEAPAAGDWLSGRAPRSHRGGHWFDPSIAHRCKASSEAPRTALILRSGWGLSPYWEKSGRSSSRAQVGTPVLGIVAFAGVAAGSGGHQRVGIVEDGPVGAGNLLGRPASLPRWRTGVAESGALLTGVVLLGAVAAGAVLAAGEPLGQLGVVLLAGFAAAPVVLADGVGDELAGVALPTAPPPRVVPWPACRGHRAAGSAGPDQGRDRQQRRGVAAAEDHRRALAGQPACLSGAAGSTC